MKHKLLNNSGLSIIATVMVMMLLALFAAVGVSLVTTGSSIGLQEEQGDAAFYIAEGGIEKAIYKFKTGTACALVSSGETDIPLGQGTFTIDSSTLYNPTSTTLSADIDASVATIPVGSTANYAPQGRIWIDSEQIFYSGISGNNFVNSIRGVAGTTPAVHSAGASVHQNQCKIQSTGKITTNPLANSIQRVVEKNKEGMSAKQGWFAKPAGTAPVSQSITGIGFKPKAVIFFWTRQTAVNFSANVDAGIGFATGSANERAVAITTMDNSAKSDAGRRRSESNAIIFLANGGSVSSDTSLVAQAELTSLDADGFTLNWTTNTDANAYRIHYIALGGDITNALASTFTLNKTGGDQGVTGVGFQPDFVMFLWGYTGAVDSNRDDAEIGVGFAQSSTAQGAVVFAAQNNDNNNDAKRWRQRTDNVILLLNPANDPPTEDAVASFVSMDSDGFTVNKSNAPPTDRPIFYLALKGGRHKVSSFNQPDATGNQPITGVGFKPEQLVLTSFNLTAQAGIVAGGAISLGAAQLPTARGSVWFQDRSDSDPSEANMYISTTDIITLATGPSTVNARADLAYFGVDGFTLNWTTANAPQRQILYWAIGPNVSESNILWREVFQ